MIRTLLKWCGVAVLVAAYIHIAMHWSVLPDEVPRHYNALGEPDAWAGKWFIFFAPTVGFVLWFLLGAIEKRPQFINMPGFQRDNPKHLAISSVLSSVLRFEVALLFSYVSFKDVYIAQGMSFGLGSYELPVILGVLFGTVFFFMFRMLRSV